MPLKNLKHYNDLLWLIYKYGHSDMLKDFDTHLDMHEALQERSYEKGKAEDLAKDLESLGPFYVKLGQILSAEIQILPPEYDEALTQLQDKATPMPYEEVEEVIFSELGDYPKVLFKSFEKEPISAASLGQVHLAELPSKTKVAVKVQRKDIQKTILEQLEALSKLCTFLEEKTAWGKRFHLIEKFYYLKATLLDELDYLKEADNLRALSQNLSDYKDLVIPLPYPDYTTAKVLTMDYIKGEKITDLTESQKKKIDGFSLAKELFDAFLKQILVDGFFQMDPHPGNIYLTFENKKPKLALFDLGMVARVPYQMQGQLIQCLLAMSDGREMEVGKIMISLGKKLPEFNEYLFRTKISEVISSYRGLTLERIPLGKIVLRLSQIAVEVGLWLPIQFSMIGKTFISLSPVLKSLDPHFEPNVILKENATALVNDRLKKEFSYRSLYGSVLEGIEFVQHLPGKLNELFDLLIRNDYQLQIKFLESDSIARNFEKVANRITVGLVLAALLISASLLMQVETPFTLFGYPGFAMILFLLAALGGFLLIFAIILNDRKKND